MEGYIIAKPTLTNGHGFLQDMKSLWTGGTTGTADAGGDTTHTVDAARTEAEDYWNGYYIKYISGGNAGFYRLVTNFVAATDTMTHLAFPNGVVAGDTYVMSVWVETLSGMANGKAAPSIENDDVFKIDAWFVGAGDENANYHHDFSPQLSSNTYTKYLLRYKTSVASDGAGAVAYLTFTVGNQCILGGAAETPQFSTDWQVTSGTITPDKTVYRIELQADDYPNAVSTGPYYVYFDFVLLHKDTFTFPSVAEVHPRFRNRYVDIEIPGRVGDVTQCLGARSPEIVLNGVIKSDTGWGSPIGEKLYDIQFNAHKEPWQWFTSDLITCKVTLRDFNIGQARASKARRVWDLILRKYDGHCGSVDWVWDYFSG